MGQYVRAKVITQGMRGGEKKEERIWQE